VKCLNVQKQLAREKRAGRHISHENDEANNKPGLKVGNTNTGPRVPLKSRLWLPHERGAWLPPSIKPKLQF